MTPQIHSPTLLPWPSDDAPPKFENGVVPEAPVKRRSFLIFGLLVFIAVVVILLRALSGGTPFLLVDGVYFPAWFCAGVVGTSLAAVTLTALHAFPLTRAAGNALVFFNFSVIYAFLGWLFIFS